MASDDSSADLEVSEIIAAAEALKIRTVHSGTQDLVVSTFDGDQNESPVARIRRTEIEPSNPQLHSASHCSGSRVVRGRGKWSRNSCQPGHGSDNYSGCGSTGVEQAQRISRDRELTREERVPSTSCSDGAQITTNYSNFLGDARNISVKSDDEKEICSNNLEEFSDGLNARQSVAQESEVSRKPREVYIPDDPLEGDALFQDRKEKRYRTGLNFAAYDRIPVQITNSNGEEVPQFDVQCFSDLNLHDTILDNISRLGYHVPTPIQKNASAYIMERNDVMACAQTGSGKTAGYLLPIIHSLLEQDLSSFSYNEPQALILCPTRELSTQILNEANLYSAGAWPKIKNRCVCGGVAVHFQRNNIQTGCNILIATPGRLLQFLEERTIRLNKIQYFVLDEADRMLEMGFMADVRRIVAEMPSKDQRVSAMFSATFPHAIQKAAGDYLKDYIFIAVGTVGGACNDIQQIIYKVDRSDKRRKLMDIFNSIKHDEKVLIFCGKKQSADFLAVHLSQSGISTTSLHGDRLQSQRDLALKEFTEGKRQVLVATAVAARGLDIPKVSIVINYDLPDNIDEYVHRIGRTGRVGNLGKAISFYEETMDEQLKPKLQEVLRGANQEIPDWMLQGHSSGHIYRRRFGATDRRSGTEGFAALNSVPDPVETEEDGWE